MTSFEKDKMISSMSSQLTYEVRLISTCDLTLVHTSTCTNQFVLVCIDGIHTTIGFGDANRKYVNVHCLQFGSGANLSRKQEWLKKWLVTC